MMIFSNRLHMPQTAQDLRDDEGGQLVELPRNYLAIVEGHIRKQRSESAVLQGWLGPTRFQGVGNSCLLRLSLANAANQLPNFESNSNLLRSTHQPTSGQPFGSSGTRGSRQD